jgi:GNAT superfamily N-acetyltransferase
LGCVALVRHDAAAGVIKKLFVRPRGRGNGAGRALMHAAVEEARRRGCSTLLLDTDRERLGAAYRLYVSLGFRECEPFATVDYRCATFMRLKLD